MTQRGNRAITKIHQGGLYACIGHHLADTLQRIAFGEASHIQPHTFAQVTHRMARGIEPITTLPSNGCIGCNVKRSTRSATKHLTKLQRHEHIIIHLNALPCRTQVHYSEWRALVVAVEATLHCPHLLLYALHKGAPIALRHAREENLYTGVHSHKRGRRDGVRGVLVAISKFECHLPYLFTHKVRKHAPCHTHDKQKSVEEQ